MQWKELNSDIAEACFYASPFLFMSYPAVVEAGQDNHHHHSDTTSGSTSENNRIDRHISHNRNATTKILIGMNIVLKWHDRAFITFDNVFTFL